MDNFSRLPDELVLRIISILHFKDAVRTSVLSTRWKYLYASMSNLYFQFNTSRIINAPGFISVVDKLFFFRNRCLVDKFCLSWSVSIEIPALNIQGWMHALMWHGIRELDLIIPFFVVLPSSLCTCKTLEVLKLEKRSYGNWEYEIYEPPFDVPTKICLPKLKVLHLKRIYFSDKDGLNRIISNCPVVEEFVFHSADHDLCKLSVSSATLKFLAIQNLCPKWWYGSFDVVVNAPNIDFFRYSVWGVTSQTIEIGLTIGEANIDFHPLSGDHSLYLQNATHLMRSVNNIRTLSISDSTLKSFQEFNVPLPAFNKITCLKIMLHDIGLQVLPYLLAHCESMEVLEIEDGCPWIPEPDVWIPVEEPTVFSCLISRLKTIKYFSFTAEIFQIETVKYLLKSARVLKSLEIPLAVEIENHMEIVAELQMLPRVSEECNVLISQGPLLRIPVWD